MKNIDLMTSSTTNHENYSAFQKSNSTFGFDSANSHSIRKPVANIMGLCCLLEEMNVEPETRDIFNMLVKSANELDYLIKGI